MTCIRALSLAALMLLLSFAASAWATPVAQSSEEVEPASIVSRAPIATDFAGPASGPAVIDPAEGVKLLPSEGDTYASGRSNLSDLPALGGDSAQQGETLDQVLHSLTVRQDSDESSSATGTGPRRASSSSGFDGDDDWVGLSEMLLNSTFAGSALRSVVEARATGDAPAGFSIFGFGSFAFETTTGGPIELTDISDGWSVTLTGQRGGDPNFVDTPTDNDAPSDNEVRKVAMLLRLFLLVESFLLSPFGIVLETIAVLLLMCWVVIQGISVARQSRSPTARLTVKPGRPKAGAGLQARRRTRRHRRRGVRSTVASGGRN